MRCSAPRARFAAPRSGLVPAAGLLLLCFGLAATTTPPPGRNALKNAGREGLPKDRLQKVPFEEGEVLTYTIAWLKIEGGEMTVSTTREATPDGVPVHRISLSATSNDYVSKFYPVNTRYDSWVDARDFTPVRFEKHAREGRYSSDEIEEFDNGKRVAVWRDLESVRSTSPIPERFQDVISSFFWLRTQPLLPGDEYRVDLYSRGKVYRLVASVLERERVETEAGVFEAVKVQPRMHESESSEDRNKGKLFLWFSEDGRRLPVMARTVLAIGSVTARLKRAAGADGTAPGAETLPPPPPTR